MKKINLLILLLVAVASSAYAQVAYNPFTQNINFQPEPTVAGFECGSTPNVEFTMGMTTAADATMWQTDPLIVTICIAGFDFDGLTAASVVSGSYSTNFNWAFDPFTPSCIIGTQNQTLPGTGSNPLFPNPLAAGDINLALEVPITSPTSTVLAVNVNLQVPPYMSQFNSTPDDNESTQTQTFCPCDSLTSPGTVASPQSFCVSGNPAAFTSTSVASGGNGGIIEYQWQVSTDNVTWTNIANATLPVYDAPTVITTTYYRRGAKRTICPNYIYTTPIVITVNPAVTAGTDGNTTVCESNSATVNLASLITGEDAGGTWARTTGTGGTFDAAAGTFVPAVGATTSTFTYSVIGMAPCPNDNSVATVNIQPGVDAGADGNTTVCESSSTAVNLASLITGEDAGGSWTRTSGTGGIFNAGAGTYTPAVGATTSTFTYTLIGTAPCPNDNSVATVNIQPGVDAGVDGNTTVCESNTATVNLASLITGEDAGGTWARTTGTGGTFDAAAGTFVPAVGATTSTFTYTVMGVAPCPNDNSVATVNIQPGVDAGADGNTTVCESSTMTVDLSTLITGEDAGGTWARTSGTGGIFNAGAGTYVPAIGATTSTFTYTVAGTAPCPSDVSIATVNIQPGVDAGVDGNTTVCESNTMMVDLATLITGEDAGGTWARTTGTGGTFDAAAGTFVPAVGATTSTFTYTVMGVAPCPNDNSVATVNIQPGVDAGADGNTTVCESSTMTVDLSTLITGEDAGGTWARTSGTGGIFNAGAGTYVPAIGATTSTFTYTVAGTAPCPSDVSVATVNIQPGVDAGVDGNTAVCESNTMTIDLATLITGEDAGGTWARTTGTGGTFDAAAGTFVSAVGATTSTFTYTVMGVAPCPSDNSVATVNIEPGVDAGVDGNTTVCESSTMTVDLSTLITGEDAGGTWARTSGTGGIFNAGAGTYVPTIGATTSTFTYTVNGIALCPSDISVATVNIQPAVYAGLDGNTAVCDNSTATVDLTTLITGEDAGGVWTRTSGTGGTFDAAAGTYTPAVGATTSTFTYTVNGVAPCPNDASIATVTISVCTIMVSGNVYEDNNGPTNVDGTGTSTNAPIYANLIDPNGNVVDVVAVNPNGTYAFNNVTTNTTYTMVLSAAPGTIGNPSPLPSLPAGWENVSEDCCDNTGNDGTTDGATTVVVGTVNVPEVNFGITQPLSLGNLVWNDLNQDGNLDAGEPVLPGATVNLYEDANSDGLPDGAAINTTTTSATGEYSFDDLLPGDYIVGVVPPTPASGPAFESTDGAAQSSTPNDDVNDDDNGISTIGAETFSGTIAMAAGTEPTNDDTYAGVPDANSNMSIDFGFFQPIMITGNVYSDQNGPTDVDGTPINNPNNTPLYANLVDPAGNVVGTDPIDPNGTYEFDDVNPNTTYTVVLSTTQGTVGNPAPTPDLPFGWDNVSEDCCDNMGNDGTTDGTVTIVVGTSDVDEANFGITEPLSLGNTVWTDLDQNGVQDPGELGLAGVTVNLYEDANSDGTPDGAAIQTATTDANGLYLFDDLLPGSYVVGATPPTPTTGEDYVSSDGAGEEANPNSDGDKNDNGIVTTAGETFSGTVALALGTEPTGEAPSNDATKPDANSNLTVDFGFFQPIVIEGNVFNDGNGPTDVDGTPINNPGNAPIYVSLVDPSGNVVGVDTVDPNGEYDFTDVEPNTTYTLVLSDAPGTVGNPAPLPNLPAGWDNVSEDCCDNVGNDGTTDGVLTITVGTSDIDEANYGIFEPMSIGNQVWIDSNKNGILDAGELPLGNAVVNLYEDVNNDGTPDGAAVATMTTAADGLYKFEDLMAGKYIVGVTPPSVTGGSYTSSATGEEVDPNLDVDLNDNGVTLVGSESRSGTVMLMSGAEPTGELPNNTPAVSDANGNLTVDFGFFLCPDNFTFADVPLCATTSIDLTAYEPAEYAGGAWTLNNVAVMTPTAVTVAGTYNYSYTNGTCTASGDMNIFDNVPDYTPTIQIAPSAITGTSQVRVILTISEILNFSACSDLYILVPKLLPRYQFNYVANATVMGGIPVNNGDWLYYPNVNPNFYIWQYTGTGGVFPGFGSSKIGYIGTYDPNNTDGQSTFSVQIFQGSGGETNPNNNTDSDLLIYFR